MPKYRLTKEAVQQAMNKHSIYAEEQEKRNLKEDQVINEKYDNIINNMEKYNKNDLNKYIDIRNKAITQGLRNKDNTEIIKADKAFHEKYDQLLSDYSADLITMNYSIENLSMIGRDVTEYMNHYIEAKNKLISFFNIDEKEFNTFIDNTTKFIFEDDFDMNSYIQNLDNVKIDDISDIENELGIKSDINKEEIKQEEINTLNQKGQVAKEEKHEEINTSNQKAQVTKEVKHEEINTSSQKEQIAKEETQENANIKNQNVIESWTKGQKFQLNHQLLSFENGDIDINYFKESEKFFKDNIKNDNSKSYVTNILEKIQANIELKNINNVKALNDENLIEKAIKHKIDMKKTYFGGYLKIREHFDSKNLFQKLFTLGESIQEYKALKKIKNEICDTYKIKAETLDQIQNDYFRDKKEHPQLLENNEVAEEKQQVTRTQSKEFQNSLIDSLSENKNLNTQKSHDKTTQVNKTMNKG